MRFKKQQEDKKAGKKQHPDEAASFRMDCGSRYLNKDGKGSVRTAKGPPR